MQAHATTDLLKVLEDARAGRMAAQTMADAFARQEAAAVEWLRRLGIDPEAGLPGEVVSLEAMRHHRAARGVS